VTEGVPPGNPREASGQHPQFVEVTTPEVISTSCSGSPATSNTTYRPAGRLGKTAAWTTPLAVAGGEARRRACAKKSRRRGRSRPRDRPGRSSQQARAHLVPRRHRARSGWRCGTRSREPPETSERSEGGATESRPGQTLTITPVEAGSVNPSAPSARYGKRDWNFTPISSSPDRRRRITALPPHRG
jgi:hypothetical protein